MKSTIAVVASLLLLPCCSKPPAPAPVATTRAATTPRFANAQEAAVVAAKVEIGIIKAGLENYDVDTGDPPTQSQGLQALVTKPADAAGWHGPYLQELPLDPWGNPYQYKIPGAHGDYDVWSLGPVPHDPATEIGNGTK